MHRRIHKCTCAQTRTHTCMHTRLRACVHTYVHTDAHAHAYVRTYLHRCMHACMRACICACVRTSVRTHPSVYVYVHVVKHAYTYARVRTYVFSHWRWCLETCTGVRDGEQVVTSPRCSVIFPWRLLPDYRSCSGGGGFRAEVFVRWSIAVEVVLLRRFRFNHGIETVEVGGSVCLYSLALERDQV